MQLSQILKTASYSQRAKSSPDPKRPTIRIAERDGTINLSLVENVCLLYPVRSRGYLSWQSWRRYTFPPYLFIGPSLAQMNLKGLRRESNCIKPILLLYVFLCGHPQTYTFVSSASLCSLTWFLWSAVREISFSTNVLPSCSRRPPAMWEALGRVAQSWVNS